MRLKFGGGLYGEGLLALARTEKSSEADPGKEGGLWEREDVPPRADVQNAWPTVFLTSPPNVSLLWHVLGARAPACPLSLLY